MILESLTGGIIGGALRLIPEAFKLFDRKSERSHELAMLNAEISFAQIRGEIAKGEAEARMTVAELDAMGKALAEQGKTAIASGWFVAALSALVRPVVTYWFVLMYSAVKCAGITLAIGSGGPWRDVLIAHWTEDDMSLLVMILTFWFVGRVYERNK